MYTLFMMYSALCSQSGPWEKAGTVNLRFRVSGRFGKRHVELLEHFTATVILYRLGKPFFVFMRRNVRKL